MSNGFFTTAPSTIVTYPLNGQVEFTIPFEFLARKFVVVTLIGATKQVLVIGTDYRFVAINKIQLTAQPDGSFTNIELRRVTSATDRLVSFVDGSILRAYDLNLAQVQTIHIAEEARDLAGLSLVEDDDGNLDARGRRIVNVAAGIDNGDAVNLGQLRQFDTSTANNADLAAASAAAARQSELNAADSENRSVVAETKAVASAGTAMIAAADANSSKTFAVSAKDRCEVILSAVEAASGPSVELVQKVDNAVASVHQLATKPINPWVAGEVIDYSNARRVFEGVEYVGDTITTTPHTCAPTFSQDAAFWTKSQLDCFDADYKRMSYYKWRLVNGNAITIACFGDSTMWGAYVPDLAQQDPSNAPASLGEALLLLYGVSCTVLNRAISGTTLRQMMAGTDGSGSTFWQHLTVGAAKDAQIIYCNHGINDSQLFGDIGQYRKDLYDFVFMVRRLGKTPCLVTPNPNPSILIINEQKGKNLRAFVDVMRSVADELDVDLVDQYYWFTKTAQTLGMNTVVPDGAHLSSRGYLQAGANLAIPLVNCHTLRKAGDIATLTNSSWFSNSTNRVIQGGLDRYPRFGTGLYMTREAIQTGINFPYILDDYHESVTLHGLHWASAAPIVVYDSMGGRGGTYSTWWRRGIGSYSSTPTNWETPTTYNIQQWAGLNICGLLFDLNHTVQVENGLVFCGVSIPEMTGSGCGPTIGSGLLRPVQLTQHQVVSIPKVQFTEGSSLNFYETLGVNQTNKLFNFQLSGGKLTMNLFKDGAIINTHTVAGVTSGTYDCSVLLGNRSLTVQVGILTHTFNIATHGTIGGYTVQAGVPFFFAENKGDLT